MIAVYNISFSWSGSWPSEELKGFNVAITEAGKDPTDDTVAFAFSGPETNSHTFYNVQLNATDSTQYQTWVQACYLGGDSAWMSCSGFNVPDDGQATLASGSDLAALYYPGTTIIDGGNIYTESINTLQLNKNSVTLPLKKYNGNYITSNGYWQQCNNLTVTSGTWPMDVILLWSGRRGYTDGERSTAYQFKKDGAILYYQGVTDARDDRPSMIFHDTLNALSTANYTVETKGADNTTALQNNIFIILGAKR